MDTIARRYADFCTGLRFDDLPEPVVEQAKRAVLDLVGVALGGAVMPFPRIVASYVAELGGAPQATALGLATRVPAPQAALVNGVCAHALDMDDGHRYAAAHPGSPTIPAALAVAEQVGASGRGLLAAVVAGFEVFIRVARSINPAHLQRGFHTTGTVGAFGAAAACARLLGLPAAQAASALGIAGLQSAGLLEVANDGAMLKPLHPGHAAAAGVTAAALAQRGAQGPRTIFEGSLGFLRAFAGLEQPPASLTDCLGHEFQTLGTYFKLYAACRHIHAAIDVVLDLRREHGLHPEEVEEVEVRTYQAALDLTATTVNPGNASAAKFSLPFSVALALATGGAGVDRYAPEYVARDDLQALARRVRPVHDPALEEGYPTRRPAAVTIRLKDGRTLSRSVDVARGDPETPVTPADLDDKFFANVRRCLDEASARELRARILHLEHEDPRAIAAILGRAQVAAEQAGTHLDP